jgi:hypothetical protein
VLTSEAPSEPTWIGRYNIDSHLITYTQDGNRYQELITQGFHGAVSRRAPLLTTAGDGSDVAPGQGG